MMRRVSFFSNFKLGGDEGFSLLELSIVLIILGILGGLSLPLLTAQIQRAALVKTRAHQDYVLGAIAAYVEKNKRFPCPAIPQGAGAEYGISQLHCRGQRAKGIIPFKTLGISEVYSHDGFKRLMTYVVEPELTKVDTALQNEMGGYITLLREDGSTAIAPPLATDRNPNSVAFLLISHGESGAGAFSGKGQPGKIQGNNISAHKRENLDDNFTFIESSQSDDILRWESRDQFLKHYVKLHR
jgi:prepilin-type N-terminal cleavage/methylation domain-containing protein